MNANVFARFKSAFAKNREREFMATPAGSRFSYEDLDRESAQLAAGLAGLGLRAGDRVTVQIAKSPQAAFLYLACLRGGFVYHPLNDAYRTAELAYLVSDARPSLIVCDPAREAEFGGLAPAFCRVLTLDATGNGSLLATLKNRGTAERIAERSSDDVAILLYTSGTTGKPKGAMITHGNLASNAAALVEAWGFTPDDRLLHALPIYHAHGLFVGIGCTLASGASMLFLPKFDAREVLHALPECTVMMGVPTHYARLLQQPGLDADACRGMRLFISGSAPLSPELFRQFRERTGHTLLERYGMTETGMNTSNPLRGARRAGSVGRPLPGVSVRIAGAGDRPLENGAIGEIQLRGPNVFPGYWQQPDKTAEAFTADGFFRTGDQGFLDDDGYLVISGRSKDLVISGGLNVYPRELEILIDGLPGVSESAIIGVPHPEFGEAVVAIVVGRPGESPGEAAIIGALKDKLAGFKVPKRVFVVADLPRNSMGKVEKSVLRSRYQEAFTARSSLS